MANNFGIPEANESDSAKVDTINAEMRSIIQAIGEIITVDFTSDANLTPTEATVLAAVVLKVTSAFGSLTTTRSLILPLKKKSWVIQNNTTGDQSILVIGATGAGVTIPAGSCVTVICDGTNFVLFRPGDSIIARKTADQTLIGTSFADVTRTGLPVEANAVYEFEFVLICDADAVTTGIDVAVNGPTIGSGTINYTQEYWTSATAKASAPATAYDNNTASTGSAGATRAIYRVSGIFVNGANAGTLIARAKREAVGAGPNVRAGSFGRLRKISNP